LALILVSAGILVIAAACRQPGNRERLRQEVRERLMAKIKEEQAIEARLRRVGVGTPSTEVLKQFGNPAAAPCSNANKCWYYDISGQKYFICFDQHDNVACEGWAYLLPQQHPRMPPPNKRRRTQAALAGIHVWLRLRRAVSSVSLWFKRFFIRARYNLPRGYRCQR